MSRLLYAVFQPEIDKAYSEGKRAIFVEFRSTKRLVEWVEIADCSSTVAVTALELEDTASKIETMYPNTIKVARERDDSIIIVVLCNMIILTQCFSATAFIYGTVDVESLRKSYPKHFGLKFI